MAMSRQTYDTAPEKAWRFKSAVDCAELCMNRCSMLTCSVPQIQNCMGAERATKYSVLNMSPSVHMTTIEMLMPSVDLLVKLRRNCGKPARGRRLCDMFSTRFPANFPANLPSIASTNTAKKPTVSMNHSTFSIRYVTAAPTAQKISMKSRYDWKSVQAQK